MKDTFTIFNSPNCEPLSITDLKGAYHSLHMTDDRKNLCVILPYSGLQAICIKE